MGNQLTGIAPSQILPVDHYLTDLPDYEYDYRWAKKIFVSVYIQKGVATPSYCDAEKQVSREKCFGNVFTFVPFLNIDHFLTDLS